jgi:hypothetical protein
MIVLSTTAAYTALHGGFFVYLFGTRMAVRSPWRLVAWTVAIGLIRHFFLPRPAFWRRLTAHGGPSVETFDIREDPGPQAAASSARLVRQPVRDIVGVFALYAVLTVVMTYPQIRYMATGVSEDTADPLFSTWRLSWIAHQLPRDPLHLFDANIFYPERGTLAYSDSMIVPSLMAAPLIWAGVPGVLACNILFLSEFALSGVCMFLLVRSLTGQVGAALLAGFIFAFLPYRFMHYAHLELQMVHWMPLCLWALTRTIQDGRLRYGLLTGALFALQTLSSMYYGIFFATFLIPVATALLVSAGRQRAVRALRSLAAGGVLSAAIIAPAAAPYFSARQVVGERPMHEIEFYSATPRDYLTAHPRNALYGNRAPAWERHQERELFQGHLVPLLAIVALWPPLTAVRIGYGVGLALAFEVSLGPHGPVYSWLLEYAMPYRGLRVPARMAMLVGLALSILVGFAVSRISARLGGGQRAAAVVVVLSICLAAEYWPKLTLRQVWTKAPEVYETITDPKTVVLNLPLLEPSVPLEPFYMYFSTFHWHNLINGYSGFSPPWYGDLVKSMETFPDDTTVAELRRHRVDLIVVHGAFFAKDAHDALLERLQHRDDLVLIRTFRWQEADTHLYRLVAREAS